MTNCPEIPNIRHLRMVQMIARLNGLSRAARYLNTSQPAVTQALFNLEARIGAPIFDRSASGTFLTAVGKIFLERIDYFFEHLETIIYEIIGHADPRASRSVPLIERFVTNTQLRALVATSDPATLEVAAAEMCVSSSSLFRSARTLERSLGKPLFERSTSGLVCNRTGEMLARQVRRAAREISFAMAEITAHLGQEDMEIVIGTLPMAGTFELAGALHKFRRLRPSVRLIIRSGTYHSLLNDLQSCRVDFMYGLLRTPDCVTEVEDEVIFHDRYHVVARSGHPLSKRRDVSAKAMMQYDWVAPSDGTPRRASINSIFERAGLVMRCGVEANSLNFARAMLLESDMLTALPHSEARLDVSLGTLTYLPVEGLDILMPKGITTRKGWVPPEAHRQFVECLREELREPERIRDPQSGESAEFELAS